jgi:hypothetical protein
MQDVAGLNVGAAPERPARRGPPDGECAGTSSTAPIRRILDVPGYPGAERPLRSREHDRVGCSNRDESLQAAPQK